MLEIVNRCMCNNMEAVENIPAAVLCNYLNTFIKHACTHMNIYTGTSIIANLLA